MSNYDTVLKNREILSALNLNEAILMEGSFNPLTLLMRRGRDRVAAIKELIEKKVWFKSEGNSLSHFVDLMLTVKCPACRVNMKMRGAGGVGGAVLSYTTYNFECPKCDGHIHLSLTEGAFEVDYTED